MSRSIKLVLYIVCAMGVIVLGSLTVRSYHQATKTSAHRAQQLARVASAEGTNAAETNVLENTNPPPTNAVAASDTATNATPTNHIDTAKDADDTAAGAGVSTRGFSQMVTYGLALLLFVIGLAAMLAYDISHAFAARAEQALFADEGAPVDPEYEQAEELWKDGKYLEALNGMRAYLKKHPREQYVALRIAEIYEENLSNPLAAALEYEEVLKKKLPPERWGWAAIHLANLYSGRLNQPDKAIELLRRIDAEYGTTTAAKKARERLLQIDPNFVPAAVAAASASIDTAGEQAPSNLPPGFRPKS